MRVTTKHPNRPEIGYISQDGGRGPGVGKQSWGCCHRLGEGLSRREAWIKDHQQVEKHIYLAIGFGANPPKNVNGPDN